MTNDNYISENRTETFKKGDKVVMHTCYEASLPKYKGKIWTCQTDSFLDRGKEEVVFLEGFSGYFSAEFLQCVQPDIVSEYNDNQFEKDCDSMGKALGLR